MQSEKMIEEVIIIFVEEIETLKIESQEEIMIDLIKEIKLDKDLNSEKILMVKVESLEHLEKILNNKFHKLFNKKEEH